MNFACTIFSKDSPDLTGVCLSKGHEILAIDPGNTGDVSRICPGGLVEIHA